MTGTIPVSIPILWNKREFMKIYDNVLEMVGHTPLLRLNKIAEIFGGTPVLAKVEKNNPAGSTKDRVAKNMIEQAEKKGLLKEGALIIEPTSGNTGVGLAMVAAVKGYKLILTMPASMSVERQMLLSALGAKIVLTDAEEGMAGAVAKAEELLRKNSGAFMPSQFDNPDNPDAHITTAAEIWEDTDGTVDAFVACIGTGGTLSGTGKYLKQYNPKIKVIGVEPAESPLITKGVAGAHGIQGIGSNFIPKNYDASVCDEVLTVKTEDAYRFGRELAQKEGLLCGISSGAALCAAVEVAHRPEMQGKNIVVILPDTGERYLSTPMFKE